LSVRPDLSRENQGSETGCWEGWRKVDRVRLCDFLISVEGDSSGLKFSMKDET
jgi:hypothetical protein